MRILIASFQAPFQRGGANELAAGLMEAIQAKGHEVDLVTHPFRFFPDNQVRRAINVWENEDFTELNMTVPDVVIPLAFPAIYCSHPNKRPWLMHQFRGAYELFDGERPGGISDETRLLVHEKDTQYLMACKRVFTISGRVSDRLLRNNSVTSTPLLHPPPLSDEFYSRPARPFIFAPSRIESLKRQELLLKAIKYVKSPIGFIFAGMGGQYGTLCEQIDTLNVKNRVRLVGMVSQREKLAYYANCMGVFFGPKDEDYGYVTLEAMLAAKPVVTCNDSGGPLAFVEDGVTGRVVEPRPEAVARAIDDLYLNRLRAEEMGRAGRQRYKELDISWNNVVEMLLGGV
ncbi:MAG: glycosyltransferase family 4 protein [Methylococcus sp.]|nr:glycosyltransferase family 4 protein [Methylococcus sp.]